MKKINERMNDEGGGGGGGGNSDEVTSRLPLQDYCEKSEQQPGDRKQTLHDPTHQGEPERERERERVIVSSLDYI